MTILTYNGNNFEQREQDGYVNLTQMAQATGKKKVQDFTRLKSVKAFLEVCSVTTGIPAIKLVILDVGIDGGSWGHHNASGFVLQT